ncbi:MAG: acyl-CoA dehydrogenase family protein, partial [Actinomycetota bacterium]|nr:acyl-CoA dehydrogenase family protein [Actinomycetota bacterium]
MSVALTVEQRELGESLRRFAARHAPIADTRKAFDALAAGELPGWWPELVANGFHAIHLPESCGGQG